MVIGYLVMAQIKNITNSFNLTPQTVMLFVPKTPPVRYAVELGAIKRYAQTNPPLPPGTDDNMKKTINKYLVIIIIFIAYSHTIKAAEVDKGKSLETFPTFDLRTIVNDYAVRSNSHILIDPRVKATVSLFGIESSEIKKSDLLTILHIHGYSLVRIDDLDIVMPLVSIKQSNAKIKDSDDRKYLGSEIVTTVVEVQNVPATHIVPLLRPLMAQQAHIGAYPPTNKIVLVDTHENTERITTLIKSLDTKNDTNFTMKCK